MVRPGHGCECTLCPDPARHYPVWMASKILLIPGIGNSGPEHWQSRWQLAHPDYIRVEQRDWDHPVCTEWAAALEHAAKRSGPESILVAHSLGCLLVAHWLQGTRLPVAGALLVAVPDPASREFPADATGFAPVPTGRFPCAGVLAASRDDPYASIAYARRSADAWGCEFVDIGCAGHINAASGLGDWSQGHDLLARLGS